MPCEWNATGRWPQAAQIVRRWFLPQNSPQSIETIRSHQAKCGKLRQSFFNLRRQQSAAAHQFAEEERPAICKCVEQSSAGAGEFHLRIRLRQHQPMREVLTLIKRDGAAS